ncbi:hypothetical protein K7X08_000727 [Anisodus acutangulus]|uniref:Uncharacterized protein n=1 Tax=Anisodus acutangulus TaxID=402998 RepID=A0A9Q1M425_9SOLA|nr:hypothetical protein K7X08_000727 [Anisodus acutangulus]
MSLNNKHFKFIKADHFLFSGKIELQSALMSLITDDIHQSREPILNNFSHIFELHNYLSKRCKKILETSEV